MAIVKSRSRSCRSRSPKRRCCSGRSSPGEAVELDEILVEIETDKVVLEVPAPAAGVLAQIIKNDGDSCIAEEVIAKIDTEGQEARLGRDADQEHPAGRAGAGAKPGVPPRGGGAAPRPRAKSRCRPPPS